MVAIDLQLTHEIMKAWIIDFARLSGEVKYVSSWSKTEVVCKAYDTHKIWRGSVVKRKNLESRVCKSQKESVKTETAPPPSLASSSTSNGCDYF